MHWTEAGELVLFTLIFLKELLQIQTNCCRGNKLLLLVHSLCLTCIAQESSVLYVVYFSAAILGQNPRRGNGSGKQGSYVLQEGAAESLLAKCRFSVSSHWVAPSSATCCIPEYVKLLTTQQQDPAAQACASDCTHTFQVCGTM